MAVDGYVLVGASGCLFPCEGEGVFAQPAQLVAGGGKIPAGAEEGGKKWVGGVGAEEEGMREAGHVLWRESCGERRRDGKGLGVKLELRHKLAEMTFPQTEDDRDLSRIVRTSLLSYQIFSNYLEISKDHSSP